MIRGGRANSGNYMDAYGAIPVFLFPTEYPSWSRWTRARPNRLVLTILLKTARYSPTVGIYIPAVPEIWPTS